MRSDSTTHRLLPAILTVIGAAIFALLSYAALGDELPPTDQTFVEQTRQLRDHYDDLRSAEYAAHGQSPLHRRYLKLYNLLELATREATDAAEAEAAIDTAIEAAAVRRVWLYKLIGGSSYDRTKRCIGGSLTETGWGPYVKTHVKPSVEAGARQVVLHNPWGTLIDNDGEGPVTGEPMQFDQLVHAREGIEGEHPPLPVLIDTFLPAWRPVLRGDYSGGEKVDLNIYLGTVRGDEDFRTDGRPMTIGEAWPRAKESASLALQLAKEFPGQVSVTLDAAAGEPVGSLSVDLAVRLRGEGLSVDVEPWPTKDTPWPWLAGRTWVLERGLRRSSADARKANGEPYPDNDWAAPVAANPTIFLRWVKDDDERRKNLRDLLERGYDVAVGTVDFAYALGIARALETAEATGVGIYDPGAKE